MQALRPDWSRPSASRSSKENRRPALFRAGRFCRKKPPARPVVMIGKVGRYVRKIPRAAAHSAPCAGSLSHLLRCCRAGHERRPVRARRRAGRADRALCGRRGGLSAADGHVLLRLRPAHGLALSGGGCGGPCRHRPRAWRGRGDIPAGDDAFCGRRIQRPGLRCDRHRSLRRQRHARSCAVRPRSGCRPDPCRAGGPAHSALRPQLGRLRGRGRAGRQPRRDGLRLRGRI